MLHHSLNNMDKVINHLLGHHMLGLKMELVPEAIIGIWPRFSLRTIQKEIYEENS